MIANSALWQMRNHVLTQEFRRLDPVDQPRVQDCSPVRHRRDQDGNLKGRDIDRILSDAKISCVAIGPSALDESVSWKASADLLAGLHSSPFAKVKMLTDSQ